jgi:hypothetical protein
MAIQPHLLSTISRSLSFFFPSLIQLKGIAIRVQENGKKGKKTNEIFFYLDLEDLSSSAKVALVLSPLSSLGSLDSISTTFRVPFQISSRGACALFTKSIWSHEPTKDHSRVASCLYDLDRWVLLPEAGVIVNSEEPTDRRAESR